MFLIVGLGNPGEKYLNNRHNVGFQVMTELARKHSLTFSGKRSQARIAEGQINGQRVALARPQTFMNESGRAVAPLINWYKINPRNELIIIYDDLDLPYATIRMRGKGGSGGQRGMQSIINHLGHQDFARIRCGIGRPPPGWEVTNFVLGNWTNNERSVLPAFYERAIQACELWIQDGINNAMNTINSAPDLISHEPNG